MLEQSAEKRDISFKQPVFADVIEASKVIKDYTIKTPLVSNARLDKHTGGKVFLKLECLQKTGAFKFRGAVNRLSRIADTAEKSVIAYSTGNHGQAIATAATLFGLNATIVMPEDAPQTKVLRAREAGAELVFYNRQTESREAIAAGIQAEHGGVIVPPGDDPMIIAGQGTSALEAIEQLYKQYRVADELLVPCGGGGFTAGCALALAGMSPATRLYAVEPELYNDTEKSLAVRRRIGMEHLKTGSICDALLAPIPAELPFSINVDRLSGVLTVSDEEVLNAMRFVLHEVKVLLEPGGAVALAALLSGKIDIRDKTVIAICSGGNVDASLLSQF